MKKEKPEIKHEINGKIILLKKYAKVYRSGDGGAITLPKQLIGKMVWVEFKENEKKK